MARRWVMVPVSLAVGALGPTAALSQNFDTVQVRVEPVATGVHMLMGAGGNIGVSSGPDGVFLIDDQYAPLTPKIEAAVRSFSQGTFRFVLNTHWHGDHTGGNENWGKAGAIIVAHENVRKRLSTDQFMAAFNRNVPASPKAALPVVTFTEAVTFYLNDDELHTVHVKNAHTDGDVIVRFRKANVVHMGDTYTSRSYPFIDLGSGGSVNGVIAAADLVLGMIDDQTKVIPGHGPLSNKAELKAFRDMVAAVRDRVQQLVAQGKTREQVLAEKPTAAFDARWGGNVDRFVGYLHDELSKK